uniref:Uncharacterized protein n=1 Tax=viral metagenome TaxID=1070528 RepID=A0A6C0EMS8_9ZZZZ
MTYFTNQDINNLYNNHYSKKELENLRYTYKNRINTYKTCSLNQFSQSNNHLLTI